MNKLVSETINAIRKIRWGDVTKWLEADCFNLFLREGALKR